MLVEMDKLGQKMFILSTKTQGKLTKAVRIAVMTLLGGRDVNLPVASPVPPLAFLLPGFLVIALSWLPDAQPCAGVVLWELGFLREQPALLAVREEGEEVLGN